MKKKILNLGWILLTITLLSVSGCGGQSTTDTEPSITQSSTKISSSISSPGKIAFISNCDGSYYTYLMNTYGSNQTQLTSGQRIDENLSWSPDGKKLAITSSKELKNENIYIINSDGSGEIQLTDNPRGNSFPSWSSDGKKIIFISLRDSKPNQNISEIYVMNADGSNQTRLTYLNGECSFPRWSPDGSKVIFTFESSTQGSTTLGIYVINADGTDIVKLIGDESSENSNASFSPDGSKIVFQSIYFAKSEGRTEAYQGINVMNADSSNPIRLTNGNAPSWSPDGKKIIFSSPGTDGKTSQISVINIDGSNQITLTDNPSLNRCPVWSR